MRLICAFIFINSFSIAQSLDSLKNALSTTVDAKKQLILYNQLVDEYWHIEPQIAIKYVDTAYQIAQSVEYPEGLLNALSNKGIAFYTVGEYDSAGKYYLKAISLGKDINVKTQANLYYLSLLKKEGKFPQILSLVDEELEFTPLEQLDAAFLRSAADVFITLGDLKRSNEFLAECVSRDLYQKDSEYQATTNKVLARHLNLMGRYDSAVMLLNESLKYFKSENDSLTTAESKLILGDLYQTKGKLKAAQEQFNEALKIYKSADYDFGIADAKFQLGSFYSGLSEYTIASKLLFEALAIYESQNNQNEVVKTYLEIGWINSVQKINDKAEEYIRKAISISNTLQNHRLASRSYNMLGIYYDRLDKNEKSIEAYRKALELRMRVGDKRGTAAILYNIGYVEEKKGNYAKTEELYLQAYELDKEIGNNLGIAISESSLGSLYTNLRSYEIAEDYLEEARGKLINLNSPLNLLDNYRYSAELYEKQGEVKKANIYYKKIIALNETLTNERISSNLAELEVKYDLKSKEREIELLNLENTNRRQDISLKEQTIKNQRFLIAIITLSSILLLLIIIAGYRLLKYRSKTNKELEQLNRKIQEKNEEITAQTEELQEANIKISSMNQNLEQKVNESTENLKKAYQELDTFFYRSSHDFRGPLTTFFGLAEVAEKSLEDDYALDLFRKVGHTAQQLDKMVNKLKAISLITDDTLTYTDYKLNDILDSVLKDKMAHIESGNVIVKKSFDENLHLHTNDKILVVILDNIIENSLNYNSKRKPMIEVIAKKTEESVILTISDNGDGIPEKYLSQVFDMYFRCNELSQGNGLGLYLVNKAVDKLDGSVSISSKLEKGTTIKVTLPKRNWSK